MRRAIGPCFLATLSGCCLSVGIQGHSTGGSTIGGSSGGAITGGTTTSPRPSTGCWPGTIWVGDECVALDCANFGNMPCQFTDGGLGTCHAGACYALTTDPNNCGAIGAACPPLTYCIKGICEYGDGGVVGCEPPRTGDGSGHCVLQACAAGNDNEACDLGFCCAGACIHGDPQNCGGCGITCGEGSICWEGAGRSPGIGCAPPVMCPAAPLDAFPDLTPVCALSGGLPGLCCGAACVDLSSDPGNCGTCGDACAPGATCSQGSCSTLCGEGIRCPAGFECFQDNIDAQFGSCVPNRCSAGQDGDVCLIDPKGAVGSCCGGTCVSFDSICGGLCQVCGAGQICQEVGICAAPAACASGASNLPYSGSCLTGSGAVGTCCGTTCVDLNSDALNCTECGRACPVGATCNHGCESCGPSSPCPTGYTCEGSEGCVENACDGTNELCVLGQGLGFCCGSTCTSLITDGGLCGGCKSTCPPGSTCAANECTLADGRGACGGNYFELSTRDDCPAGTICTKRQICEPIRDCSPGSQTPGATEAECLFGPNSGPASCCGGKCVTTELDPENCGDCGIACPSGICIGGPQGYETYGCLPAGPTDDCFPACGPGTVCANGSCVGSACGYNSQTFCLDQDQTIGFCCDTGVCAHLPDDSENCGQCGNACPAGQTCENGACSGSPQCGPGNMYGFCNLDAGVGYSCCPSAGCTNLFTDSANCGYCGGTCAPSFTCVAGACRPSG
jgi:hypothetical protein